MSISRTAAALTLLAILLAAPALAWQVPPGRYSLERDSHEKVPTYKLVTSDWQGIEPSETTAVEMNGKLYLCWQGKTARPDGGSRGAIFFRTFDDSGPSQNATWGPIFNLTPTDLSGDRFGHANDYPKMVEHQGKAYVVWESEDDSQKPAPRNTTLHDILMKSFDGQAWSDLAIVNEAPPNGTEWRCFHPGAASYGGKLFIAYSRVIASRAEIVVRSQDGAIGPESVVSLPSNTTRCDWPNFTVYQGSLHLAWEANDAGEGRTTIYMSSNSGGGWSAPREIYTIPVQGFKDAFPKLVAFSNPASGLEELWAVWRTVDGEGVTYKGPGDQDIVMRRVSGTALGPYVQLSPPNDREDDNRPNPISHNGLLYIVWQTKDDLTSDGTDYDIVMRSYDGQNLSPVKLLSLPGDRCESVVIDTEPHNLGDDEFPSVATYRGRLFALWETYDNVTGIPDKEPGLNNRSIILKLIEDVDSDGDGYPDSSDVFPYDPKRWDPVYSGGTSPPENDYTVVFLGILLLLLLAAVALAASGRRKKGGGRTVGGAGEGEGRGASLHAEPGQESEGTGAPPAGPDDKGE